MDLTDRIRDMILDRRPTTEIKRAAREDGMRSCASARCSRARRRNDPARNQQGDLRRMSRALRLPSWLAPPEPEVAIEFAPGRLTVARLGKDGHSIAASAVSERCRPAPSCPSLVAKNIEQPTVVIGALKKALERGGFGRPKRVVARDSGFVGPRVADPARDRAGAAGGSRSADPLAREKATPFPIEDAVVSYSAGAGRSKRHDLRGRGREPRRRHGIRKHRRQRRRRAGVVDVASLSVMNAAIATGQAPQATGCSSASRRIRRRSPIMRGQSLVFHRHRVNVDDEPLSALVHQTAMYHEDRLGGSQFQRVVLSGGATDAIRDLAKREISDRLQTPVQTLESLARERGAA
jgi:hypothetical protein